MNVHNQASNSMSLPVEMKRESTEPSLSESSESIQELAGQSSSHKLIIPEILENLEPPQQL